MRITGLHASALQPLKLRQQFSTSNVLLNNLHFTMVRIETDAGIVGQGEAMPAWEVTGETQASVIGCIELLQDSTRLDPASLLVGKSIATVEEVRDVMRNLNPTDHPGYVVGNSAAKAAIEQAMLDCCAQYHNTSIHELLGIAPRDIPSAIACGIRPLDETFAWLENALASNPQVVRLKLAGAARDVDVVRGARAILDRAGSAALLAADANQGFVDVERTVAFCRQVEGCLAWLEQPFHAERRTAFKEARAQIDVPLMADEALHSVGDASLLLELGGVDYFNVKLMKSGGLFAALDLLDLADANGIRCHVGSMLETSLGCLMGYYAACARPSQIVSTDLLAWSHLETDPWGLLEDAGNAVRLSR